MHILTFFSSRADSVLAALLLLAAGAAANTLFHSKPTELESRRILRDIETVRETPNVQIPIPEVYSSPPEIVESSIRGVPDAKLYYFARHQTVQTLLDLFNEQFIRTLRDNEGNALPAVPYTADINPATNQIVVSCPSVEYARQVLVFFEQVDVVPIQIKINCLISEVYAGHTMDWETMLQIEDLFGQDITLIGKLPGAALRDLARSTFGATAGYVDDTKKFSTLVDALVSRGYLKILMNPQLEVVNGQTATIKATENVTIDQVSIRRGESLVLSPRRVVIADSLEITPQVFSDGMIGLKTVAVIGSKSTPEGIRQASIITERKITVAENRIRPGESLIIGGITKTEQRSVVRGVPGLKDIPLLGVLFSAKDFEERAKEVVFILTPTISTMGRPNKDIVDEVQRKQTPVRNTDLIENFKDPLGRSDYLRLLEEEAVHAETARLRADIQRAVAERRAEELTRQLELTARATEDEKTQIERLLASLKTAADAEAARAAAEKAAKEAEESIAEWLRISQARDAEAADPTADSPVVWPDPE